MSNFDQAQLISDRLIQDENKETGSDDENSWLKLAQEAYRSSTDYMDSSLKRQWEKNMSHFHSKHATGSKYYSDTYKYRSKFFRPKVRSMIKRNEAAAAMAYFATGDAVNIEPEDDDNPEQAMAANIHKELLNYRLDKSIPWFQTLIGAYQEAMNIGMVVSYQYWEYKEVTTKKQTETLNEFGQKTLGAEEITESRIIKDKPRIQLRPAENIRIDESADWSDPIGTSPFLIDQIPMYVYEIKEKMIKEIDNEKPWIKLSESVILSAVHDDYDSLRRTREGENRQDSKESSLGVNDYRIVWVHRNFIKKDGEEYVFYTLSDRFMLSEPVTVYERYKQEYRPYVMGVCNIEVHRTHPSSASQLGEQTQNEINDIANTRMDNVRLALNKRHYVRRGANVDHRALMRSAPGAGILMDDVNMDVKQEQINDVTGSSFQEQNLLNIDFDEITGNFSTGTVQSNRQLNETVGGIELINNNSNIMSEYQLRVFNETWVEPVLRQILDLEKRYETDQTVIAIAGRRAGINKKYGVEQEQLSWRDFQADTTLRVSVGFGATNPQKRIEKISMGLGTLSRYFPDLIQGADRAEIVNEVFGALGYKDGKRFFPSLKNDQQNPEVQQLQQQIQQLQQMIQTEQHKTQGKAQLEQIKQQGAGQREQMKLQYQMQKDEITAQLKQIELQLKAETNELSRSELLLEQSALLHQQRVTEIQLLQQERGNVIDNIDTMTVKKTGMDDTRAGVISRNDYGQLPFGAG